MENEMIDDDLMTVKEFSERVGIPVSALRHYHKCDILIPAKIGAGLQNNYRYYSPMQITVAKMVRVLSELHVPLQKISELKNNRTPEMLLKLLYTYGNKIEKELRMYKEMAAVVKVFTELLNEATSIEENEIYVAERQCRNIILGERTDFSGEPGFMGEFLKFINTPHKPPLNVSFPIGGYWDSMDGFLEEPKRPERFFSLDEQGLDVREKGLYLIAHTNGYYGEVNDLPDRMVAYAAEHGLEFSGPVYNLFITDEVSVTDPNQYLLQASAAVTETRSVISHKKRYLNH